MTEHQDDDDDTSPTIATTPERQSKKNLNDDVSTTSSPLCMTPERRKLSGESSVASSVADMGDDEDSIAAMSMSSGSIPSFGILSRSSRRRTSKPKTTRSQRNSDENVSTNTSLSRNVSRSTPIKRPAGMTDRMRQRLRPVQSERNLDTDTGINGSGPKRTVSLLENRRNHSSSRSVSARSVARTSTGGSDDALLLQLTQKVRQLEEEKTRLVESHEDILLEYEEKIEELEDEKEATPVKNNSSHTEPQAEALAEALAKIATLEGEQKAREALEEQLRGAQETIEKLQEQVQPVEQRQEVTPEKDKSGKEEVRKPESPLARPPRGGSPLAYVVKCPLSYAQEASDVDDEASEASTRIDKLKAFRRSRELQLKDLVLDKQISPTDVQTVIKNLQDELKAAKEVIYQQKMQLKQNKEADTGNGSDEDHDHEEQATDVYGRINLTVGNTMPLEKRYKDLQKKYATLEIDRAWGEFQLRDRITNDALKFHRRLRHWKKQNEELQTQLEKSMEEHADECKSLRAKLTVQEQAACLAEEDLQEYKLGTEQSLQLLVLTQDRLIKAELELEKYCPVNRSDPQLMQQANLLQVAMERKQERGGAWGSRLVGVFARGEIEQRNTMG
jgi:hypothetical protein